MAKYRVRIVVVVDAGDAFEAAGKALRGEGRVVRIESVVDGKDVETVEVMVID